MADRDLGRLVLGDVVLPLQRMVRIHRVPPAGQVIDQRVVAVEQFVATGEQVELRQCEADAAGDRCDGGGLTDSDATEESGDAGGGLGEHARLANGELVALELQHVDAAETTRALRADGRLGRTGDDRERPLAQDPLRVGERPAERTGILGVHARVVDEFRLGHVGRHR